MVLVRISMLIMVVTTASGIVVNDVGVVVLLMAAGMAAPRGSALAAAVVELRFRFNTNTTGSAMHNRRSRPPRKRSQRMARYRFSLHHVTYSRRHGHFSFLGGSACVFVVGSIL